jgi:hypothetical protein
MTKILLLCLLIVGCSFETDGLSVDGVPLVGSMACPPAGDYCVVIREVLDDGCSRIYRPGGYFCERLHEGVICSDSVELGNSGGDLDFESGFLRRFGCSYWSDVYHRNPEQGGPDMTRPLEWSR